MIDLEQTITDCLTMYGPLSAKEVRRKLKLRNLDIALPILEVILNELAAWGEIKQADCVDVGSSEKMFRV